MSISPLQKARYEYAPKLPGMLRHGIADICVKEGVETQSVADQEKIKALFPNGFQWCHSLAPCSLWLASHALSPSVGIRIQRPILITGGDASLCTSS